MLKAIFTAALLALPGAALAEESDDSDKFFFFNNPAVSREQALADWDECRDLAGVIQPPPAGYMYTPGLAGAAVGGLLQGLIQGAQRRHMTDAAVRKCMNIKGYQRYTMAKEDAQALYSGKWPQIREKLADRAVAPVASAARLEP